MANIAEILKNAPKGLKLYSPMVGECELERIDQNGLIDIKYINDGIDGFVTLTSSGEFAKKGKCVLFPDKKQTDWADWQEILIHKCIGSVVLDNVTGCSFIVCKDGLYDDKGRVAFFSIILWRNYKFSDVETEVDFINQLRENGYYYCNGNIYINKPQKASREDYKKIIELYGVRNQLKKLSEEVYELQEAVIEEDLLCGVNGCNNKNITEEIADVFVILRQLAMQFDIAENDIEDMADYKVKRTLERIEKEM